MEHLGDYNTCHTSDVQKFESVQDTAKSKKSDATHELFETIKVKTGFEYFAVCHMSAHHLDRCSSGVKSHKTNFNKTWVEHYQRHELHIDDPVIAFAPRTSRATPWQSIISLKSVNKKQKSVLNSARDYGLRSGIFMSCHQFNGDMQIISLANSYDRVYSSAELSAATIAGNALADQIASEVKPIEDIGPTSLSTRELECLNWVALGKSSSDIEVIVGISRNTVDFHINNTMRKLGTSSRTLAVVKALRLGLICP